MSNHVKIVIVNDTDYDFAATGEENDFVLDNGSLAPGSNLPPPVLKKKETCDFTVMTPLENSKPDAPRGPEGQLRYELQSLRMRVWIIWTDATRTKPGKAVEQDGEMWLEGVANPFRFQWMLLDGGFGELDSPPVKLTDEDGKPWTFDNLEAFHSADETKHADKSTKGALLDHFKILTATFTLRVKNDKLAVDPPAPKIVQVPGKVVRPTGGAKAVVGKTYRTWDAPDLSPRRKKLLATIGHELPQVYAATQKEVSGSDPRCGVPFQWMTCWAPGGGTTSCTNINGMLEKIVTGKEKRWAFTAFRLEEAWVPWAADPLHPMPNVGDIYLLYRDVVGANNNAEDYPHMRHCGVILYVPEKPGEDWITADGGQMVHVSGDGAFLNSRPWELREPSQPADTQATWDQAMVDHPFARPIAGTAYPYLGGGSESKSLKDANRLIGWLDLDSPSISFQNEKFDDPAKDEAKKIRQWQHYTEYDYQFLGAWIDDLRGTKPGALKPWLEHLKDPKKNPPPWPPPKDPKKNPPP